MAAMNSPLQKFHLGQCWTSEGEPELGLGFVVSMDEMSIAISFPSATQARMYRKKNAPLRRLEFRVGEKILSKAGTHLVIDRVETRDGLLWYVDAAGGELCESELSHKLTLTRPMDRFLAGQWDPLEAFELRRRSLQYLHEHLRSPARGMIGPRAQLLPHQLFVTTEICRRGLPRALLADEVGLGKTIEAGWIMHRLLQTGRIRRVLIIVPETLVNQWFVELFKRYNLSFWVPAAQIDPKSGQELEASDFEGEERVILSLESVVELHQSGALSEQDWDLVVVDEAHRIPWAPDAPSLAYDIVSSLAQNSPGLLLLTATPEQLGLEGHFSRLHLIDPHRFPSLSQFKKEHERYLEVVGLAEKLLSGKPLAAKDSKALKALLEGKMAPEILSHLEKPFARRSIVLALIDHYGTGRVYFRNSRSVVELEHCAFPKRSLVPHVLKSGENQSPAQAMTRWLGEFAKAHRGDKTLLICASARKATEWEQKLKDEFGLKAVAFHEDLSLLARDRNAAYFADPQGASILLCSEIGGEGRNFQHASHLILADLPEDPDVLEQRIGRLDRIGQASDISLHVPYFEKSQEERLLRWHDEVFGAFVAPPKGAATIYAKYRDRLAEGTKRAFEELLASAKQDYQAQLGQIEAGRDRLIEINSFDPEAASQLAQSFAAAEKPGELKLYLDDLFDAMGIHSDDLDADSMFAEPGHSQYASYFTGLPTEGFSFTFSRKKALARHDLAFMTWDHPMVSGTLEALSRQEYGNVAVAAWPEPLLVAECSFTLEPAAHDSKWYGDEFFPTTPIRVVLEATGKNLTAEWPWDKLKNTLVPLPAAASPLVRKIPGERVRGLLSKALAQADATVATVKREALDKMTATIDDEISRLNALQGASEHAGRLELGWWKDRKTQLQKAFAGAELRLDSFLLIIPSQLGG
jgi:ATP-dependent helicase HepA